MRWDVAPTFVISYELIQLMRRDYAPHEVSWRAPLAHSIFEFYWYAYALDPMRHETLCGATPGA